MYFDCLKNVTSLVAGTDHCDAINPLDIDKGYWDLNASGAQLH